jgi:hypothetical protein
MQWRILYKIAEHDFAASAAIIATSGWINETNTVAIEELLFAYKKYRFKSIMLLLPLGLRIFVNPASFFRNVSKADAHAEDWALLNETGLEFDHGSALRDLGVKYFIKPELAGRHLRSVSQEKFGIKTIERINALNMDILGGWGKMHCGHCRQLMHGRNDTLPIIINGYLNCFLCGKKNSIWNVLGRREYQAR